MFYKVLGVLLLVAGVLVLVYRGFSVPRQQDASLGPIEVRMKRSERIEIPVWAGVAAIGVGGGLLLWGGGRKS